MNDVVMEKLNGVFSQMCGAVEIKPDDLLREDLGFDSLMLVTLMVLLEDEFQIVFMAADLDPFALTTVQNVEELIQRYVAGG